MNSKIPIRQLAAQLAVAANLSPEEAETFIKAAFGIISDELRTGAQVRIKDFGTFTLTTSANDPVHFTPDPRWQNTVNAPFSMFEPVVLNPGVTEEMLGTTPIPEEEAEEEAEKPAEENRTPMTPKNPKTPTAPAEEEAEEPAEEDRTPMTPMTPISPAEEEAEEDRTPKPPKPPISPAEEEEDEEEEDYPSEQPSRFWPGFVIGLIIGLAIGVLALYVYMLHYLDSAPQEIVDTAAML